MSEAQWEWRIHYRNRDELDAALTDFRILFAYHSNRIENEDTDYHDTRDVFENGKVYGYTGDPRTLFEIQNQRDCYATICFSTGLWRGSP